MFEKVNPDPAAYADRAAGIPLTFGQSATRGFISGMAAPFAAIEAVGSAMSNTPGKGGALEVMQMYEREKAQGNISSGGFLTGEVASFFINPASYSLMGAGGAAARKVTSKLAIKAETSALAKFAYKGTVMGAEAAASMIPNHIAAEFDEDTNSIHWGGVAKHVGVDFGFGVALAAVPFTWGMLRGKFKNNIGTPGEPSITQSDIDYALSSNAINKNEHAFMSAVVHKNPIPEEALTAIMRESNLSYDSATGHVNMSIMKPATIEASYNSVADALGSNLSPELKNAFNDYLVRGDLNKIILDPKMIEGLQGVIDHIDERLVKKDLHLGKLDNKVIEPMLGEGIDEIQMTQSNIYEALVQKNRLDKLMAEAEKYEKILSEGKFDKKVTKRGVSKRFREIQKEINNIESYKRDLDLKNISIPTRVKERIAKEETADKLSAQIEKAKNKLSQLRHNPDATAQDIKMAEDFLKNAEAKLSSHTKNIPTLLNPTEEMRYLYNALKGKKYEGDLLAQQEFWRLSNLTAHWKSAKILHKRIMREELYDQQKGFADIARMLVQLSKTPDFLPGKPEDAVNYFKERITKSVLKSKPKERPRGTDSGVTFEDLETFHTTSQEAKEVIALAKARAAEFANEDWKKSFLKCATGIDL